MTLSGIIFAALLTAVYGAGAWGWRRAFQSEEPPKAESTDRGVSITDPWDVQIMLDLLVLMILAGMHLLHTPHAF